MKAPTTYLFFRLILTAVVIDLVACKKITHTVSNLNGNNIILLGHGGMGIKSHYPLNSYESINQCLSLGADGFEVDVQLSKDSVLVAFHNKELEESTNLKGLINSLNWSDIKHANYTDKLYSNYNVVSLEEIIANINGKQNYKISLDCKLYPDAGNVNMYANQYCNAITRLIEKFNLSENCFIETQSAELITLLQKKNTNKLKLFLLTHSFTDGFDEAKRLGVYGISIASDKITKQQIESAHSNNFFLLPFGT